MTSLVWTAGRARAVDQLAGSDGVVVGVAVDHRDSMSIELRRRGLPEPSAAELTELKLRVARVLAPGASAILLDAEYAAAQALAAGVIPRDTALVVPLEAQGYGDGGELRRTSFLPGWSARQAAALGAVGCKLLLPYRPDLPQQSGPQDEVVRAAVADCRAAGVALLLEPIVYPLSGEDLGLDRFSELVIDSASALSRLGPDVLKLQYPGSPEGCRALDQACGASVPWVLLGGGSDAGRLEREIADACAAGASGFVVGRTLFEPALVADPAASEAGLRQRSLPMLDRFAAAARAHAHPWRDRVGAIPPPGERWWLEAGATATAS
jgi:tagatose-1,6-bisphosphate aldolase